MDTQAACPAGLSVRTYHLYYPERRSIRLGV